MIKHIYKSRQTTLRTIAMVHTSNRRSISHVHSRKREPAICEENQLKKVNGKIELDSHADTIVAGANCCILSYTGRVCDVAPYREDYEAVSDVPIVKAATAWQSPLTGQVYILILNEALWMGDSLEHTLLNPNQIRHYGHKVQDDPTSDSPMYIMTHDASFSLELEMSGTIVHANTHTPTSLELQQCPHIILSSAREWDPANVSFSRSSCSLEEEVTRISVRSWVPYGYDRDNKSADLVNVPVVNRLN